MTTDYSYIVPKPGLRVRIPGTRDALPAEGAGIRMTGYWWRRIQDGDVSFGKAPRPAPAKSTKRAAASGAQE
ncbi:DUF2635 domain-containing protein [Luteimonas soli]|uniref:DUF2635 domain-containing protein n=1 Tax=Luteimonas soli TaxID=1648966 RepID=A0ABV7XKV8_9GAMM